MSFKCSDKTKISGRIDSLIFLINYMITHSEPFITDDGREIYTNAPEQGSTNKYSEVITAMTLKLRTTQGLADCIERTALDGDMELRAECVNDLAFAFADCGLGSLDEAHRTEAVKQAIGSLGVRFHSRSQVGMPITNISNFDEFVQEVVALSTNTEVL
jgi:hypothetical protein